MCTNTTQSTQSVAEADWNAICFISIWPQTKLMDKFKFKHDVGVIDSGEQKSLGMNACTKNHVNLLNSCLDAVKQVV